MSPTNLHFQSVKALSLPFGNQLTFRQYSNPPPLKTSTQTFVPARISLTAIVSKMLESFPYRWLFQSIVGKIDPLQFGALRDSSASMALVHLLHKWYEACDDLGSSLRICLLDFSKAFDRIDHNDFLRKLQQMTIHPVLNFSLIGLPTSCL